ncbi:hypothetical protein AVEN_181428-1 [Araneus ventricosus]|uniref:Uncharacterized protein n=1 Tax=Araneus ventricosus TaxID=182803 RepID=A0A4Y2R9P3_ARAVE|nr:hypothetical protein AVEN_181428-1 [Araneus ventricosus]
MGENLLRYIRNGSLPFFWINYLAKVGMKILSLGQSSELLSMKCERHLGVVAAPRIYTYGEYRSAVTDRILDQLKKIIKSESVETVRVFHGFSEINPFERNETFGEHAKESLPWAVWKTDGIKGLVKIAINHYFKNGGPMECEEEEWKKLGEMMMESIFSARWPVGALQPKPECSICTEPLYTHMKLPCGQGLAHGMHGKVAGEEQLVPTVQGILLKCCFDSPKNGREFGVITDSLQFFWIGGIANLGTRHRKTFVCADW